MTLKIFARGDAGAWEAAVADHNKDSDEEGFGRESIRKVLDEFELSRDFGHNYCLFQELLGSSLADFLRVFGRVREPLVQSGIEQMLKGLCYLHLESFLIHAGSTFKDMKHKTWCSVILTSGTYRSQSRSHHATGNRPF